MKLRRDLRPLYNLVIAGLMVLGTFGFSCAAGAQGAGGVIITTAPAAGDTITNRAYVTFDVGNQPVRIDSNTVGVYVTGVPGLTLVPNIDRRVVAGSTVNLAHRLTNTGNIATSYFVQVSSLTGDSYDLTDLKVFKDSNGNGVHDTGEPEITDAQLINLEPGAGIDLVLEGRVPNSVSADSISRTRLTATVSGPAPTAPGAATPGGLDPIFASVTDTLTTITNAVVVVRKSATTASSSAGQEVGFTVVAQNQGAISPSPQTPRVDGVLRSLVLVRDKIPVNTTLVDLPVLQTNALRLYHVAGDADDRYVTAPPVDLSTVDAVAIGLQSLQPNTSATLTFRVRIGQPASKAIANVAVFQSLQPVTNAPYEVPSNEVRVTLPTVMPTLDYYINDRYEVIAGVTGVNRPLYLQGWAGACNQDSSVAEVVQFTVKSGLTGDSITVDARETGPNTGLFRVINPIPTNGGNANATDGSLSVRPNDELDATLQDCGGARAEADILVDPFGVVFDSRTNAPVPGARVTLIDVTGQGNGGRPGQEARVFEEDGLTPAPSSVITGANGAFQFPLVAGSTYRLTVIAPPGFTVPSVVSIFLLPPTRRVDASASYGGTFIVDTALGAVQIDIPVDSPPPAGLFLQKTASRRTAAIADFIDYELRLRNNTGSLVNNTTISDVLPRGFAYVRGSARVGGAAVTDPAGSPGPNLTFTVGTMQPDDEIRVNYRVRVQAGVSSGDQINRAQASGSLLVGQTTSNTASARVRITAGMLTERAILFGKVFVDKNENREQEPGEPGVPGVRVWLEDGTYAITDSEGKYSIYGLTAVTHVVRVDRMTLPVGARLEPLTVRHAGRGDSAFADLLKGEMHKVNFALIKPTAELLDVVKKRQAQGDSFAAEVNPALSTELRRQVDDVVPDRRGLPTTGMMSPNGPVGSNSTASGGYDSLAPGAQQTFNTSPNGNNAGTATAAGNAFVPSPKYNEGNTNVARPGVAPAAIGTGADGMEKFKEYLNGLDNSFAVLTPKDGTSLPMNQVNVRIKGMMGSEMILRVNGQEVSAGRIGAKLDDPERRLHAREYVGVQLKAGDNVIEAAQKDPFGNERNKVTLHVTAPGDAVKLILEAPKGGITADARTPFPVTVRIVDAKGTLVTARTPVTLEIISGSIELKDLNPNEPGLQIFVEGGALKFNMIPPADPGDGLIRAMSGVMEARQKLSFVPELRPLMVIGSIEGQVNALNFKPEGVSGNLLQDDFQALKGANGNTIMSGRTALFLKGRVLGKNLLTLRYDSEADRDKLFRDIQPDEFYPVYGDAAAKGFDAQSTGKLFVRLDRERNYFLYGDFTTASSTDVSGLANYQRSLTGGRQHLESDRYKLDLFASRDSSVQVVDEIRANGTSGGYLLRGGDIRDNSERVEILVRDRNNPGVILEVKPQTRFRDYEFDYTTGRLLFRDPINSVDANLNPVSIRISYEVDSGGPRFWVQGVNGSIKVTPNLEIGGSLVNDKDPRDNFDMRSVNATYKFDDKTSLTAELATTQRDTLGSGSGSRLEFLHDSQNLQARIFYGRTDAQFDNPGSILSRGRSEASLRANWRLDDRTRLLTEALRTGDVTTGNTRTGWQALLERTFNNGYKAAVGLRHANEENPATSTSAPTTPVNFTSILTRLTVPVNAKANIYGEAEADINDFSKNVLAAGGDYAISQRSRLYARHEFISSLSGRYALNDTQTQQNTVFGVDTSYSQSGHLFSEYRMGSSISGREGQAALGLRDAWNISEGVKLTGLFERTKSVGSSVSGISNDTTALGGGIEYTRSEDFKGSARLELRRGQSSNNVLGSFGVATRLNPRFTFLSRGVFDVQRGRDAVGNAIQNRFQAGLAYRDRDKDRWSGLAKYEYRQTKNGTAVGATLPGDGNSSGDVNQTVHLVSIDANYQSNAKTTVTGHYAAKFNADTSGGVNSNAWAQMVGARVIYELSRKTEVSGQAGLLWSAGGGVQTGFGAEIGRMLGRDLWLSAGYNVGAASDGDLTGTGFSRRGPYMRIRFKFDESLFGSKEAKLLAEADRKAVAEPLPRPVAAAPKPETRIVEVPVISVDPQTKHETTLPVKAEVEVLATAPDPTALVVDAPEVAPASDLSMALRPRIREADNREFSFQIEDASRNGLMRYYYDSAYQARRSMLAKSGQTAKVARKVPPMPIKRFVVSKKAKMQPSKARRAR